MPVSAAGAAQMLSSLTGGTLTSLAAYAGLHTGYSTTGGFEMSGGGYARQALTWTLPVPSGGPLSLSSAPSPFTVPAGDTVAWIGLWSAVSGGNFAGMAPNGGASQYVYTAATSGNLFTAVGSSYGNGSTVVLLPCPGSILPGGFATGTIYYVISASGTTFQLSTMSGGSANPVGSAGAGIVQGITPDPFPSGGTYTLSADTIAQF